jgi:hypothetical protein
VGLGVPSPSHSLSGGPGGAQVSFLAQNALKWLEPL